MRYVCCIILGAAAIPAGGGPPITVIHKEYTMRIMAIDYGDAHTGAAVSALTGLLAGYTETIHTRRQEEGLSRLGELIGGYGGGGRV